MSDENGEYKDNSSAIIFDQRMEEFKALMAFGHVEAQLVWQRYNVMLAAHALIAVLLGALIAKGNPENQDWIFLIIASFGGFLLCICWYKLTMHGWELEHVWVNEAKKYPWKYHKNPYVLYEEWCKNEKTGEGSSDQFARTAKIIIYIFSTAYIFSFILGICKI